MKHKSVCVSLHGIRISFLFFPCLSITVYCSLSRHFRSFPPVSTLISCFIEQNTSVVLSLVWEFATLLDFNYTLLFADCLYTLFFSRRDAFLFRWTFCSFLFLYFTLRKQHHDPHHHYFPSLFFVYLNFASHNQKLVFWLVSVSHVKTRPLLLHVALLLFLDSDLKAISSPTPFRYHFGKNFSRGSKRTPPVKCCSDETLPFFSSWDTHSFCLSFCPRREKRRIPTETERLIEKKGSFDHNIL